MHPGDSRRWWALGGVMLAVLAAGLDATVLSVALPTLAAALHASEADLQWFSSGYLLVVAAAMLPAGLLGDRFGRKRVLQLALVLFGAGSAACALATTPGEFIAARLLLGLAAAAVIVMAISALTVLFPPDERPKAVGVWAAANFLAVPVGPVLGGWLLTRYWWGWVFVLNAPVALVGLLAVSLLVPESRAQRRPGFDPLGIAASAAGLVGMTYGLIRAGSHGWGDARALALVLCGVAALAGFFAWERRLSRLPDRDPLVDPGLFRSAAFTWGVGLMTLAVLALYGVLFALPQYFQGVLGLDAMGSGVRLLPLVGGLILGAVPSERLARRTGNRIAVAAGCAVLAAGLALGARTGAAASGAFVAAWTALTGLGMGLAMSAAASAALSELPAEHSGVGSGVMQAVKNLGGPFGGALMGSVLNAAYQARVRTGGLDAPAVAEVRRSVFAGVAVANQASSAALLASVRSAFTAGLDRVLWASAAIAAAGAVLALALPARAASAEPRPGGHGVRPRPAGAAERATKAGPR